MHRFPIPSKEITQVGCQEDSETLEIQFVKDGVYQFSNDPSTVFDEFMIAPSKEGYYHSKIGERFPCSRTSSWRFVSTRGFRGIALAVFPGLLEAGSTDFPPQQTDLR